MAYQVKEIFYTLQGEGAQTGRAAIFCRFAGCNLWSGREEHRSTAICTFCDTDFVGIDGTGGGQFASASALVAAVAAKWPAAQGAAAIAVARPLVVCTGGEPLLQLDLPAVEALHAAGFEIALETNGTRLPPAGIDWVTVSPKANAPLVLTSGNELKLVYPQALARPERFECLAFERFYLQPMDGPQRAENTRQAIEYCLANPRWRLSLQAHKDVGIR